MLIVLMLVVSYLLGSIPTAVITGRILQGVDIRELGSGNAGATNTARVLGLKAGGVVAVIDVVKGLVAVLLVSRIAALPGSWGPVACGIAAIIGHVFPAFARFRGGKGAATAAGVGIGLFPLLAPICLGCFVVAVVLSRRVVVGSLAAALALPVAYGASLLFGAPFEAPKMVFAVAVLAFIVFNHRSNIRRLVRGEEKQLDFAALFRHRA